jgi:beta-glucan synthesis-associated protein KRE6
MPSGHSPRLILAVVEVRIARTRWCVHHLSCFSLLSQLMTSTFLPIDDLHNPDPKRDNKTDFGGSIPTLRGLANIGCIAILTLALIMLFAGYPIMSYIHRRQPRTLGASNLGGVNGSGQVPQMTGNFGLIDNDTPEDAYSIVSDSGETWKLVFSDEFNQDGRTFYPGDDPSWVRPISARHLFP